MSGLGTGPRSYAAVMDPLDVLVPLVIRLVFAAVFFLVLFYVVRTAVKEGVQIALRTDLLDRRALGLDPDD